MYPLSILLQFCNGGDLHKATVGSKQWPPIGWTALLQIFADIAAGLLHLATLPLPIVHRDLRGPNILIHDWRGMIGMYPLSNPTTTTMYPLSYPVVPRYVSTIGDFGMAYEKTSSKNAWSASTLGNAAGVGAGNPRWMSPEQVEGAKARVSTASDVWMAGATMTEALSGLNPFHEHRGDTNAIVLAVSRGKRPPPPPWLSKSSEIDRLIASCCTLEASSRITIRDLLDGYVSPVQSHYVSLVQPHHYVSHIPPISLSARVHPGETASSWVMEGLVRWLTGPSQGAAMLRRSHVIFLVPMLNPDGVIVGNYRCVSIRIAVRLHSCYSGKLQAGATDGTL
jgi:serine/threonine protein kinase